ncbi:MAG: hypothetical protein KF746_14970 [Chitinophagaceae bacterium]|nr:hypothetical protein [Chitinophagaceae bacterium]
MSILSKLRWIKTGVALMGLKKLLSNRTAAEIDEISKYYSKKIGIANRIDYILAHCADKKVLHFGFTDYPYTKEKISSSDLLHLQLKEVAAELWGADNNKASIYEYVRLTGDTNVLECDIMNIKSSHVNKDFDIVLLGEIIEHLKNPHQAIEALYDAISGNTLLLVTTPNYISLQNFAAGLHQMEMIHPDHYWYFSPVTLLKLFPVEKFELIDLNFGMHFQKGKELNYVLKQFPFLGECIIAVLKKRLT